MDDMQIFNYKHSQVRTIQQNNETWWVLKDVCNILGIVNPRDVFRRLDEDEKGVDSIDTLGGKQNIQIISESGLYTVILRSDKQEAKTFKKWVTSEVLPSIRKHGMYAKDELLNNPDLLIEVATALKEEREKRIMLEKQAELDKPKVLFAEKVAATSTLIDMGKMAKMLHDEHIEIGRNRLFEWLRNKKILMQNNIPYQQYIDNKCFIVKEVIIDTPYERKVCPTTYVTGKGQIYIAERLRQEFVKEKLDTKVVLK